MTEEVARGEPIALTPKGDRLVPWYDGDEVEITSLWTGLHEYCGGKFVVFRVNEKQKVLLCRICGLRDTFPLEIKTLGELRTHFQKILGPA